MDNGSTQAGRKFRWPATGQLVTGILLVVLGSIFFVGQLVGETFIRYFWPLFLVMGGLAFYAAYYIRAEKPPGYEGLLFPGTYLIVLGFLFLFMVIFGWQAMRYLWPTFVLGVSLGLLSMYVFGPQTPDPPRKDLLTAIRTLFIIAAVLYIFAAGGLHLWPVILILIGILIIFKGWSGRKKKELS